MDFSAPIIGNFLLSISDQPDHHSQYSTSQLQKGLLLSCEGINLVEEAVGFGVPILKRGLRTYFPGSLELIHHKEGATHKISATYTINLVEKITRINQGKVRNNGIYVVKNLSAAMIRHIRPFRRLLTTLSSGIRRLFRWETAYELTDSATKVILEYVFKEGSGELVVESKLIGLESDGFSEVIIMNEHGANHFDKYVDSSGIHLMGEQIGTWDEVLAEKATFISTRQKIKFTLSKIPGSKLYRGRELIGSRLAWSGFGYSISPAISKFSYTVKIERTR
jgi:hypothetical protein